MDKKIQIMNIICDAKHEGLDLNDATNKILSLFSVGVNEAVIPENFIGGHSAEGDWILDNITTELSEVELVCDRVNNFDNNRCINCGAKAGHKCELKTN